MKEKRNRDWGGAYLTPACLFVFMPVCDPTCVSPGILIRARLCGCISAPAIVFVHIMQVRLAECRLLGVHRPGSLPFSTPQPPVVPVCFSGAEWGLNEGAGVSIHSALPKEHR